ncbi:Usg family protein [Nitrospirillum sp. BR 11164]|uniref:usg protein n=1 Tax=Nitrospirillum sp. BR 11164 TaxID=3104324 RepID=UPI002AFEF391|nr:Usg family protein [Nitrospirillum sp. BR 11164]MEA1648675.1 Usg family protein [Nitrospirillum sp. BR 11164]
MTDLEKQLLGWRLTTAEIVYRMPDHPGLLQAYVWQELDQAPRFPQLRRFLDFWEARLDGRIHRVRVVSAALVQAAEIRHGQDVGRLH